jgi:uncharacterized protein (TIGR02246 family)
LRRFRSAITLLPAIVLLSACRIEPNPRPEPLNVDSAARADIGAAMAAYRQALLQRDARAIASFYTADARFSHPDVPHRTGTGEIRQALEQFFAAGGAVTDVRVDSEELDIDGATAYELGAWEERAALPDGAERVVNGRYMIRWRRGAEARWRIDRFLLASAPARPPLSPDSAPPNE